MYYIIYKTTNTINGKVYIGKHKTKDLDDGYLGSGKLLHYAIKKYGIENFTKEIIYICDTEQDMNLKEQEIVTEEFCLREDTYNLCVGGHGGFSYINRHNLGGNYKNKKQLDLKKLETARNVLKDLYTDESWKKQQSLKISESLKKHYQNNSGHFLGKNHSEESKKKISKSNKNIGKGSKNSQYGTIWITNGQENKKIKKDDLIPKGWYKGRKLRKTH